MKLKKYALICCALIVFVALSGCVVILSFDSSGCKNQSKKRNSGKFVSDDDFVQCLMPSILEHGDIYDAYEVCNNNSIFRNDGKIIEDSAWFKCMKNAVIQFDYKREILLFMIDECEELFKGCNGEDCAKNKKQCIQNAIFSYGSDEQIAEVKCQLKADKIEQDAQSVKIYEICMQTFYTRYQAISINKNTYNIKRLTNMYIPTNILYYIGEIL